MCGELIRALCVLENGALEQQLLAQSRGPTGTGLFITFNYIIYGVQFDITYGITNTFMFIKEMVQ